MRVMKLKVECYSGRKADERPVQFWLDRKLYCVETVLEQWCDPEHIFFKVRAEDGNFYILRQQTSAPCGQWDLISFRQNASDSDQGSSSGGPPVPARS
jgi:hypothetical protein